MYRRRSIPKRARSWNHNTTNMDRGAETLPDDEKKGFYMKHMQSIERIPLSEICIEPYQRVLNNARVKRIADNFDPARVGVLLSKRGPHSYAIVDGQHRLCAMRQHGVLDAVCIVAVGMTYEDEANYFRNQSRDTNPLNAYSLYKAGVEAKDEHFLRIEAILVKNGFAVGLKAEPMVITAVNTLSRVMTMQGEHALDLSLKCIRAAWHGDSTALRREMFAGVSEFARRYESKLTGDLFKQRLGGLLPADLFFDYRARTEGRINAHNAFKPIYLQIFCGMLRDYYNKGLGSTSKLRLREEGEQHVV